MVLTLLTTDSLIFYNPMLEMTCISKKIMIQILLVFRYTKLGITQTEMLQ